MKVFLTHVKSLQIEIVVGIGDSQQLGGQDNGHADISLFYRHPGNRI